MKTSEVNINISFYIFFLIVVICSSLTWANYVGVREGIRTMAVITFFKIVPIILLIVLGLQYVSGDTLFPETMPKLADLGGPTLLLIYAFVGFESATIISGETTQPKKTLPRALVQTVIAIGVLYFLIVLVFRYIEWCGAVQSRYT